MKPTIFPNCKLFYFNRENLEFGTINPDLVNVEMINGYAYYSLIHNPKNLKILIVQALNFKKASAKFLTIIQNDNLRQSTKDR